ncbi:MAG: dihydrolipoamide acetyltransferase family protein [Actinomycetota bacterium]|nr:dihydrolipoamide acetyltransferase family protein [Actinomycetota bacterium]
MADVTLPQLGETVTEGTITRWFKKVGDTVAADEALFEVSTDKVDTEVPSPVAGVVQEIRVAEGDTVPVGAVIAVVGAADAAPGPAEQPAEPEPAPAPAPEPEPAPAPEPAPEPAGVAPAPVVAAEPAPAPVAEPTADPVATPAAAAAAAADDSQTGDHGAGDNRLLSPVVRRLVAEHSINPDDVKGTGPGGRITRDDVLDFIDAKSLAPAGAAAPTPSAPAVPAPAATPAAAPAAAPAEPAPAPAVTPAAPAPAVAAGQRDTVVALSKIRKLTGSHMIMSKSVSPHAFSVVEVDFANVDATRGKVKGEWKASEGFSLTYLPFITRAVVDALAEFPHLNASVGENELVVHNYIDVGIAVDLNFEGLLVPVVRSAETKRLRALAREINDLASRAKTRKLSPDEISGGTFTITNNGSAGSVLTMPVINQPQVAILSTDAIVRKPVVAQLADGGEAIVIHPVGNLAMAWDHRAFDGAYAAGFLVKVKQLLETRDWSQEL